MVTKQGLGVELGLIKSLITQDPFFSGYGSACHRSPYPYSSLAGSTALRADQPVAVRLVSLRHARILPRGAALWVIMRGIPSARIAPVYTCLVHERRPRPVFCASGPSSAPWGFVIRAPSPASMSSSASCVGRPRDLHPSRPPSLAGPPVRASAPVCAVSHSSSARLPAVRPWRFGLLQPASSSSSTETISCCCFQARW